MSRRGKRYSRSSKDIKSVPRMIWRMLAVGYLRNRFQAGEKKEKTIKEAGGKLIKVEVEAIDDRIESVQIKGDFFVYPEDTIELIEKALLRSMVEKNAIDEKIEKIIKENDSRFFGIKPETITEAIIGAVRDGE